MSDSTSQKTKNNAPTFYRTCQFCNAILPKNCYDSLCTNCKDRTLFLEVKDFIRENDVNEFQVAEYFNIPLRIVKGWIKEGRIEYKEDANGIQHIVSKSRCSECGVPITFGTHCIKCLKKINKNMKGFGKQESVESDKMRFLNNEIDE